MDIELIKTIFNYDNLDIYWERYTESTIKMIDNKQNFKLYGIEFIYSNGCYDVYKESKLLERPIDLFMHSNGLINSYFYIHKYLKINEIVKNNDFEKMIEYILIKQCLMYEYNGEYFDYYHYKNMSKYEFEKLLREKINKRIPLRFEILDDRFYSISNINGVYMIYDPLNYISNEDIYYLDIEKVMDTI